MSKFLGPEMAGEVKLQSRTLTDRRGMRSQRRLQLCDREVQPGISPQATGKATRKPSEDPGR